MAQLVVEDPGAVTPSGRLYVSPDTAGPGQPTPPTAADDPWASFPTERPSPQGAAATPTQTGSQTVAPGGADEWAGFPTTAPKPKPASREYGTGETLGRGLMHGASMGLEPAMEGASAEANADIAAAAQKFGINPETAISFLSHVAPGLKTLYGAGSTIAKKFTGNETPAYDQARAKEAQENAEASAQHPYAYGAGDIAGALTVPLPGFGAVKTGAKLGMRVARGMGEGMIGGGAFGAGNAIGEGEDTRGTLGDTATGVLGGGLLGGAFGGVFGRRPPVAPTPAQTSGERAVEFSHELGAPLPRALGPTTTQQRLGALARQTPITGERIGGKVKNTLDAAEQGVKDRASQLTPDASRSATNDDLVSAVETALKNNKKTQNAAYTRLRGLINPDQRFKMPATERALREIALRRSRSGASLKQQREGLQEAWRLVEEGGGFNGAHERRALLRNPPASLKLTNPGYDKGAYNKVADAMTQDLQGIVRQASTKPADALRAFNEAEKTFGYLAEENKLFERLRDAKGEGAIAKALSYGKEKGGNLDMLRRLKVAMPPNEFDRVSGTLLSEMGFDTTHTFSFTKFQKSWDNLSDEAKNLLFTPQHRKFIDDVANLGEHVRGADKFRNHSNSAGTLVFFEVLKTVGEMAIAAGAGALSPKEFATSAGTAAVISGFGYVMGNPARAAAASSWVRAYRALTLNQPTPARIAAFKVATRNLSNNINVPVDRLLGIASNHLSNRAGSALPAQAGEPNKEQLGEHHGPRP